MLISFLLSLSIWIFLIHIYIQSPIKKSLMSWLSTQYCCTTPLLPTFSTFLLFQECPFITTALHPDAVSTLQPNLSTEKTSTVQAIQHPLFCLICNSERRLTISLSNSFTSASEFFFHSLPQAHSMSFAAHLFSNREERILKERERFGVKTWVHVWKGDTSLIQRSH